MNLEFLKKCKSYLPEIYKDYITTDYLTSDYLTRKIDCSKMSNIFSNTIVEESFKNVIDTFYRYNNYGKPGDSEIRQAIKTYELATKTYAGISDLRFRYFLHMYKYYTDRLENEIVDCNNYYDQKKEPWFFINLSYVVCNSVDSVYTDLINGNRWWEYDSATTLRAQFMNDKVIIPEYTLQFLCRKYLGRYVDLRKELHLNEGRTTPPMELVNELDKKMKLCKFKLVYAYVGQRDGKFVIIESPTKPEDDRYFLIRYVPMDKF